MTTDYLSRQPYLDLLKSIIENQKDNETGYSFAIDGEWGSGKTWILQELEKQLLEEKDNKYLIFHYNAWENDFYDEPLVAILSVMIECLKKQKTKVKEKGSAKKVLTSSITALTKVAGTVIEKKWNINPNDIIESVKNSGKAINDVKLTKSDFNRMLPLENALNQIKDVIKKLSKRQKIILVVDELDRCLPEYAIKVLERLHHICNKMPVIQILSINKKNLAESISNVFGKSFSDKENINAWQEHFADNYLKKFVDVIIPLSNGKLEKKLETLKGLENEFNPYIRSNNSGKELIRLDDNFLAEFISKLMDGIERRLQEKIFMQVALCHKLTLKSGVDYKQEQMTYAILIYEIVSCICRYVFQTAATCKVEIHDSRYQLNFYRWTNGTREPKKTENRHFNDNLVELLSIPVKYSETNNKQRYAFEIIDTKTYIMAFFYKQEARSYDLFQNALWDWIQEDKTFLQKYDEIMNTLTAK